MFCLEQYLHALFRERRQYLHDLLREGGTVTGGPAAATSVELRPSLRCTKIIKVRTEASVCDLNVSASSWSEDRQLEDQCDEMGSSPTYAAAASKALPTPAATAEEGRSYCTNNRQHQRPCIRHFCHCSNHPLRELCIMCLQSKTRSIQGRSPPCESILIFALYLFFLLKLSTNFVCLVV
jgi:hypothetical protein